MMDDSIFISLSSNTKLHRDRGIFQFQTYLKTLNELGDLENVVISKFSSESEKWEEKFALLTSQIILFQSHLSSKLTHSFITQSQEKSLELLEDPEFRVRIAAGELLGAICKQIGPQVYVECHEKILDGVRSNLERNLLEFSSQDKEEQEKLRTKLLSSSPSQDRWSPRSSLSDSDSDIFHDTAGWKNLETWMACLRCIIINCGNEFHKYLDEELLDLIFISLDHTNRFVRETGYNVCGSIVGTGLVGKQTESNYEGNLSKYGEKLAKCLAKGLADNWSQVRLSSSVATRQFLLALPSEELRHNYYPYLVPPMCLNRYYVAEGVKIMNQETWRLIMKDNGPKIVETYINHVVDFYIQQSEADNHAVREAACSCIAELASKINREAVQPYVSRLLEALLVCFQDDSWPVRDTACVACGQFILCFPDECRPLMDQLYKLFFNNLQDCISSVRQGAAQSLANVIKAYGDESVSYMFEELVKGLEGIDKQEANAEKYSGLESKPAVYGVVKRMRDNDMDIHTNKQMYSCGSLAPKMHSGKRGGGCMDHQFRQPSEPWMLSDGCIILLAELSSIPNTHAEIVKQFPLLVKVTHQHHYTQHVHLLETFCKQLPIICKGLGKKSFKMHLEQFLDSLMYSLNCDNQGTSIAALECLLDIGKQIGPSILNGRLENYNPRYLEMYQSKQMMTQ